MVLREIAAGKVTFENIHSLPKQRKTEKIVEIVDNDIKIEE